MLNASFWGCLTRGRGALRGFWEVTCLGLIPWGGWPRHLAKLCFLISLCVSYCLALYI